MIGLLGIRVVRRAQRAARIGAGLVAVEDAVIHREAGHVEGRVGRVIGLPTVGGLAGQPGAVDGAVDIVELRERIGPLLVAGRLVGEAVEEHGRMVHVAQRHLAQHLLREAARHRALEDERRGVVERDLLPDGESQAIGEHQHGRVGWLMSGPQQVRTDRAGVRAARRAHPPASGAGVPPASSPAASKVERLAMQADAAEEDGLAVEQDARPAVGSTATWRMPKVVQSVVAVARLRLGVQLRRRRTYSAGRAGVHRSAWPNRNETGTTVDRPVHRESSASSLGDGERVERVGHEGSWIGIEHVPRHRRWPRRSRAARGPHLRRRSIRSSTGGPAGCARVVDEDIDVDARRDEGTTSARATCVGGAASSHTGPVSPP